MTAALKIRPSQAAADPSAGPVDAAVRRPGTPANGPTHTMLSAARILQIHQKISEGQSIDEIAASLCASVQEASGAARVSLIWQDLDDQTIRIKAVSTAPVSALRTDLRNAILAAAHEAMAAQTSLSSLTRDAAGPITAAHRALDHQTGSRVVCVPMALENTATGALCLELPAAAYPQASATSRQQIALLISFLEHLLPPCSRLLRLSEQFSIPLHRLLWCRLLRRWHTEPRALRQRRLWISGAVALVLLALLIPFKQPISSDARLEGAVERDIAAPVDGYIESVHVHPGDTVQAGQILATLRPDELEVERNQLLADLAQHQVSVNAAMVSGDRSAMATARARIDQASAKIALLDLQISQTTIRAPLDATVLRGDLADRIQTPVQRGEALFTLAPDNDLRVLINVDEKDIASIRAGQRGRLAPSALPWDRIDIEVTRLSPVASVVEGKNIVEVRARLAEPVRGLKPGQQGTVHLDGRRQSLARRWAAGLLDAMARSWWRWQPW